ncbi:MAG: hypothetical protein EOO43_01645 [Flavobacterium sp.]|nr:MAG: hypothetical protein EOO43_01645 [Flavobacterium sp.]
MFDEKTRQNLGYYVYMLLDPRDKNPFYIGKGNDNRVFSHIKCALSELDTSNLKYDLIRIINDAKFEVEHIIIRHGLSEHEALQIEASLIDSFNYCGILLSNIVRGHHSILNGLMTSNEIISLYNAEQLDAIDDDCILININRKYPKKKTTESISIYDATKEIWTINKRNLSKIKYVLSEYRGLIVEVFKVEQWYEKERGYLPTSKRSGETKIGYGFNGVVAIDNVRDKYINKSIAHTKKKGTASVIRYRL